MLAVLVLIVGNCQSQQFYFSNISTADGLPSAECYGTYTDSKGYLWIRTQNGLCKYNGRDFRVFDHNSGMSDLAVYALQEDLHGRLWFATSTSDVGFILNDQVNYLPCTDSLARVLGNGKLIVYDIALDKNDDIYLSSHNKAYCITSASGYRNFSLVDSDSAYLKFIKVDRETFVIPNSIEDNSFYNQKTLDLKVFGNMVNIPWDIKVSRSMPTRRIYPSWDEEGSMIFNFDSLLCKYTASGKLETLSMPSAVLHTYIDRDNRLWAGCLDGGLFMFYNADLNSTPVRGLQHTSISYIQQDYEGGIWAASLDRGLYFCKNLQSIVFPEVLDLRGKPDLLKIIDGKLYLSNLQKGLVQWDLKTHQKKEKLFTPYHHQHGYLDIDKYGDKLLVTCRATSFLTDTSFNSVYEGDYGVLAGRITGGYNCIVSNDSNVYSISTFYLNDFKNKKYYQIPSKGADVVSFEGNIFAATRIGVYKLENDTVLWSPEIGIKTKTVRLLNTPEYLVVLTREKGIHIYNQQLLKVDSLLVGTILNDVCLVDDHVLCIATNKGIFLHNLHTQATSRLDTSDGIVDNEVYLVASYNNTIYYSTVEGVSAYELSNISRPYVPLRLYLVSSAVNGNSPLQLEEVIPYNSKIEFKFDPITFRHPSTLVFKYRLLGFDARWYSASTGDLVFTNLADGNYQVEVYIEDQDGTKSDIIRVPFSVGKPFFKRLWFWALLIVLAVFIIFLIVRFFSRRIARKEAEKTRINKLLAEYQLMGLKAQMNPHFIFNCLNSIQRYVLDHDISQAYDYIAKFSKLIRRVLDTSDKTITNLSDEIETLQIYVELEQMRFEKQFVFELHVDESISLDQVQIPSLLLQPYVENAIWHGLMPLHKSVQGKLSLTVTKAGDNLLITIDDNGIGRIQSQKFKSANHISKGMSINQRRLDSLNYLLAKQNASVVVDDISTGGTRVTISLPHEFE